MTKTNPNRSGKIPKFVKKLSQILENQQLSNLISWLPDGNGFQIHNVSAFTQQVLPIQFKHKNMASFVRQLNMYGFNRPSDSYQHVYMHPRFQNGNLNNMKFIKRKSMTLKEDTSMIWSEQRSSQLMKGKKNEECVKIKIENQQLRKENEELKQKLFLYEEMKNKIQNYSKQISHCLEFILFDDQQNQQNQKQTNSSDNSQNNNLSKSSFSICQNNCALNNNLSYNLLLKPSQGLGTQIQTKSS